MFSVGNPLLYWLGTIWGFAQPGVRHYWLSSETAPAEPLDKPLEWAVGFFFGNTELSLELWNIHSGIYGFDD